MRGAFADQLAAAGRRVRRPTASASSTASRPRSTTSRCGCRHAMGGLVATEIDVLRRLTARPGAALRRRARRLEGLRQARRDRQPARQGRPAADRRRHGLHLPQGPGPRGRQEPARGGPARHLPRLPRAGRGVRRRDRAADRHRGRHRVPVRRPRARAAGRRGRRDPGRRARARHRSRLGARRSPRPSPTPGPSSGTARWASSRPTRSPPAPAPSPRP